MLNRRTGAAVAALSIFLLGNAGMAQNEKKWAAGIPGSKMAIETPLKRLISKSNGKPDPNLFLMKRYENYRKNVNDSIGETDRSFGEGASIFQKSSAGSENRIANADSKYGRKVRPGKVNWHSNTAAAALASKNSGKPVLVFQMMGKLDQEFC